MISFVSVLIAADFGLLNGGIVDWILAACALMASLVCWLPNGRTPSKLRSVVAVLCGIAGLVLLWRGIDTLPTFTEQASFWVLASLTISCSVATISARNPVYSAIWFAISLLGTASLFFLQNAQFLGIATVAVYAGAIVVTFLFVLMLSQPAGHAFYDRLSWGMVPRWSVAATTSVLVSVLGLLIARVDSTQFLARSEEIAAVQKALAGEVRDPIVRSIRYQNDMKNGREAIVAVSVPPQELASLRQDRHELEQVALKSLQDRTSVESVAAVRLSWDDLQSPQHMAQLGSRLFSRQWISIQAAGALLMAALVGAVAIASRDETERKGK